MKCPKPSRGLIGALGAPDIVLYNDRGFVNNEPILGAHPPTQIDIFHVQKERGVKSPDADEVGRSDHHRRASDPIDELSCSARRQLNRAEE
jgi:hypothetical protein